MSLINNKKNIISGEITLPGDKSLSHRAVMLGAFAKGTSVIHNFLPAEDTVNTLKAFEKMGVHYEGDPHKGTIEITSDGLDSLKTPKSILDMGNSGTGARLLLGFLSGKVGLEATVTGDHTLQKRPMKRVTEPLTQCGAIFEPKDNLPIKVIGTKLSTIERDEVLGSAQVKSALLLAAVASNTEAIINEKILSRDHTENMFSFTGIDITIHTKIENNKNTHQIHIKPPYTFQPKIFNIWGDISSAAFFIVLGALIPNSHVTIRNVLLNPFRDQYLKILQAMGAKITIIEKNMECGEKGGDIQIQGSTLKNIEIPIDIIPSIIDEIPILTIAGMFSEGKFSVRNAEELRHKESDRIKAMVTNLINVGYSVEEYKDGFSFEGKPNSTPKGNIETFCDHRIIMSFEIANLVSKYFSNVNLTDTKESITIDTIERQWVATSFPSFYDKLNSLIKIV